MSPPVGPGSVLSQGEARSLIRANCHPDRMSAGRTCFCLNERRAEKTDRPSQRSGPVGEWGSGQSPASSSTGPERPRFSGQAFSEPTSLRARLWPRGGQAQLGRSACQRQGRNQSHPARPHRHVEVKNSILFVIRIHIDADRGAISCEQCTAHYIAKCPPCIRSCQALRMYNL